MAQNNVNTMPLHRMIEALRLLQSYTKTKDEPEGNAELQMNTMRAFLHIATRHPNEVSLGEAEKLLGFTQTTASRTYGYLAAGNAKKPIGYRLIEVYEDPFYRRRKLAKLTPKGIELANKMSQALQ
jgi:DNA-binding MarR family transcriptional regulator